MLLGGIHYLLPVIEAAHKNGYYTITADYLPNNIAHRYSDEYVNVSITDKESVLKEAQRLKIDGIMSFACDPGVIAASYVQNEMNLPSFGPFESVVILQNKDKFRTFLRENGFNTPWAKGYSNINDALSDIQSLPFPVIVKPTDSAGSKGVSKVETIDDRGASVNVGGTSIFLPRREMIGDEKFAPGASIKLYVNKVDNTKKLQIDISRACPGFLEALFKEEISDVYNGNIVIKKIARQAGERSKVAVYSEDPNVDPAGACIGPNGSRVQKIVSSLGNGESKEKVDVIQYSDNPALFILEALKPARVAGIKMNDDPEVKECTAIVKDDSLSLAIGKKGVNVRLAVNLTGYKIDIKTESEAEEEGFTYTTTEELQSLAASIKAEKISELQKKELAKQSTQTSVLPGLPEGYVAPQQRVYEAEKNDFDDVLVAASEEEEISAPVIEEAKPAQEAAPVEEKKEETPVEFTAVKTTTSLSDLEASLEADSKKQQSKTQKSYKNKKKEEEKKEEAAPLTPTGPQMSIYTDEELKALEEEELEEEDNFDDEDVDYDDYDEYYDEDR